MCGPPNKKLYLNKVKKQQRYSSWVWLFWQFSLADQPSLHCPSSCAHVAAEASGQPAGRGQAGLPALPDTGHPQTHHHVVQKPDTHLRGEKGHPWASFLVFPGITSLALPAA